MNDREPILFKAEFHLDLSYPGWKEGRYGDTPICVPVCSDVLKSYVGSRDRNADGFKEKTKKKKEHLIVGDDAELVFFEKISALKIGGVVIAKFQWQSFRKLLKLEDFDFGDFEIDFIFLHPQLGICAVEVKASTKIGSHGHGKYQKAIKQLSSFPGLIAAIYKRLTEKELSADHFGGAALFVPNSYHLLPPSKIDLTQPVKQPIDYVDQTVNFINFWDDKIQSSILKHGHRNLFNESEFRLFLLFMVGYRNEIYIAGPKFSLSLAKKLHMQQIFPFFSKRQNTKRQNCSFPHPIKWDGTQEHVFYLTNQQEKAFQCSDDLQLISGAPGTGKTIILLLKALKAASTEGPGRVVIQTWFEIQPKLEMIMNAYKSEWVRDVVFLDVYESPKEDDDVFRDEIGPNALPFLLLRAKKHIIGRTVAVFTGNVTAGDYKREFDNFCQILRDAAENKYTIQTLETILRSTKNIAAFWTNELEIQTTLGHDFEGEIVVHQKFPLVSQVQEAVAATLKNLLAQLISPPLIAIIGPRRSEVRQMLEYLKPFYKNSKIKFGTAKQNANGENVVTVDKHAAVLSNEWVFVIMFSLCCSDFHETFLVTAASRAISKLFFLERDYCAIQNSIDQHFDRNQSNMLEEKAVKLINVAVMQITQQEHFNEYNYEEKDEKVLYFHQNMTILKQDYVTGAGVRCFFNCDTFSKCLLYLLRNEKKFLSFISAMNETKRILRYMKERMKGNEYQKPEMVLLKHRKFFERSLNIQDDSDIGKIYIDFCTQWCKIVMKFYHRRVKQIYRKRSPLWLTKNRDCAMVVDAANMLVENRCGLRFVPVIQDPEESLKVAADFSTKSKGNLCKKVAYGLSC